MVNGPCITRKMTPEEIVYYDKVFENLKKRRYYDAVYNSYKLGVVNKRQLDIMQQMRGI